MEIKRIPGVGEGHETGPNCVTYVYHHLGVGDIGVDEYVPPPTRDELEQYFDFVSQDSNPQALAVLAERDGRIVTLHMAVIDEDNPNMVSELHRNGETGEWNERKVTIDQCLLPYPETYPEREILYLRKKGIKVQVDKSLAS